MGKETANKANLWFNKQADSFQAFGEDLYGDLPFSKPDSSVDALPKYILKTCGQVALLPLEISRLL